MPAAENPRRNTRRCDDLAALSAAVRSIDSADRTLAHAKRRLRVLAIVAAVLMVVSAVAAVVLGQALNYTYDLYSGVISGRSRSAKSAQAARNLHYWLEENFANEFVVAAVLVLFAVAIVCFVALSVLFWRWQNAKDAHAKALAEAESSVS